MILLDIKLPLVDGIEVLRQVRADASLHPIPVVMMTSSAEDRDLRACYALGANSVVDYPVPLEELAETFRRVVAYWTGANVLPRGAAV